MFGILVSGFFTVLGWVFQSVIVKFVVFFALVFITTQFVVLLIPMLPGASELQIAFSQVAPGIWYFLDLFKIGYGVSACLGAYVTRFIIRRIPVIG